MVGGRISPLNDKISVKHGCSNKFDGVFVEFSDKSATTLRTTTSQSNEILSTADLISAVSNAWDHAKVPLSVLLSKNESRCKGEVVEGRETVRYLTDEGTLSTSDDRFCSNYLNRRTYSENLVREDTDVEKKRTSYEHFSFWRVLDMKYRMIVEHSVESCVSNSGRPRSFGSICGWMSKTSIPNKPENQVKSESKRESNQNSDDFSTNRASGLVDTTSSCDNLTVDLSCDEAGEVDIKHIEEYTEDANLMSLSHACEDRVRETEDGPFEYQKDEGLKNFKTNSSEVEISLPAKETPRYTFAKQEHAFAGAMAGIFVSLCLHPMDTVKTVIQSCPADQKPLNDIGRIISNRGLSGLYRGISSNILSSAPISAVYTFTYESVKKSLLPFLPKEYQSLAHCTAGGSASVATSFIFTPSERIKQQMQVGSHYRNCWNALIEVVHKGGFSSLYAGWGAVLCRNVPHSIIKFYTYESLKQTMLPSPDSNAQPNTSVTLVCGGLAGSMASLFTTPFDVVKTRLQTQIPGSMTRYKGVFNTLTDIGKHEGVQGLYRGLTPRLVMYMIQGALFFASYESFKRLLSLDVRQLSSQTNRHELNMEEGSTTLPLPVSVSA